jgi:hypothetical protein
MRSKQEGVLRKAEGGFAYLVFRRSLNIRLNTKYATPLRRKDISVAKTPCCLPPCFCFFATLALLRMAVKQARQACNQASKAGMQLLPSVARHASVAKKG